MSRPRSSLLTSLAGLMLLGALAGCGGSSGSPEAAREHVDGRLVDEVDEELDGQVDGDTRPASVDVELPDPCTLLSPSDVETVTGTAVGPGYVQGDDFFTNEAGCGWSSPQGNAVGRGVAVTVIGPLELYSTRHLFDQARTQIAHHEGDVRDVAGIGEEAYGVVSNLNGGTQVNVLVGEVYLRMVVGEADTKTEEHFTMAKELAAKAVSRL